jgi:tRNA dimethylallyltransferase
MQNRTKTVAIIGATASGKSDLALQKALETDSIILSLDSLSVYKEIDIASAKPSNYELTSVPHHGINELFINEEFNAQIFIDLYKKTEKIAYDQKKQLIIVGGTSFYLKSLFTGLSTLPKFSESTINQTQELLKEPKKAFLFLQKIDNDFSQKISESDVFRIEKALLVYFETLKAPTLYFKENRPVPIIPVEEQKNIEIFKIEQDRHKLRQKIRLRTEKMVENGLIDEVFYLAKKYKNLDLKPFNTIGIKETIQYLKSEIESKDELIDLISIHTGQLAKRQDTFNRTQFKNLNITNINKTN